MLQDRDRLAATAGPQARIVALSAWSSTLSGWIAQVLLDQSERLVLVGRPALAQEQRDAGPVGPGLVARRAAGSRSSRFRYSDRPCRDGSGRETRSAATRSAAGSAALPSSFERLLDQGLGLLGVAEQQRALGQGQVRPIGGQGFPRGLDAALAWSICLAWTRYWT